MTAVAEATIEQRVERGAAFLDLERPGWWRRTDLDTLDVEDPECCPLGQEYGDFDKAPATRSLNPAYGFYRSTPWIGDCYSDVRAEYAALTEAWRTLIERRRAEAGAAP